MLQAGVMQKVLICDVRKTIFIDPLPTAVGAATRGLARVRIGQCINAEASQRDVGAHIDG